MSNRRAIAFLGMDHIARMLALSEGLRAVACRDDFLRDGVAVLIEGDALDEVEPGIELPRLSLALLDRTELAMQAKVLGWGDHNGGPSVDVLCPLACSWFKSVDGPDAALALLADAVQQHLTEAHPEAGA